MRAQEPAPEQVQPAVQLAVQPGAQGVGQPPPEAPLRVPPARAQVAGWAVRHQLLPARAQRATEYLQMDWGWRLEAWSYLRHRHYRLWWGQ